jgi:hypothetical protein
MPRDSIIPRLIHESPEEVILYQPGLAAKPKVDKIAFSSPANREQDTFFMLRNGTSRGMNVLAR